MSTMTISRRRFTQLLGLSAAAAVVRAERSFATATAQKSVLTGITRLSANENPYGPSPHAHDAMRGAFNLCCRYPDEQNDVLIEKLGALNKVDRDQIALGDGSSEILKICAEAFTGPERGNLVAADPTFEAILEYAKAGSADVVKVPLTNNFEHDLPKMSSVAKRGLIYVCNPNNPTATITPKERLREFIETASPETMILVDEAYFHYANNPDYETAIPLIKNHPNLIVARTFSKVYGMAGLRCGYCVAQKETIARIKPQQMWDSVNVMALAAAIASLGDANQVTNGCRWNSEAKTFAIGELDKVGYKSLPSEANFFMVDCRRSVVPLIQAMKQRNVQVGRLFPAMPNHMRVTVGKRTEMQNFLAAFRQVIAA